MQQSHPTAVLALDVGERRVGVAAANTLARLPRAVTTLDRGEGFWDKLDALLLTEAAELLVVGLPRNLDGDDTDQTRLTRAFMEELKQHTDLPIVAQDEALTSHKAKKELDARGKAYKKSDIDALAAVYILEDYLASQDPRT